MKAVFTDNNDVNCAVLLTAQFYGCRMLANTEKGAGSRKALKMFPFRFYPVVLS